MADQSLIILTPGFPKDEHDSTCLPSQQLFVLTAARLFPGVEFIVVTLQYPPIKLNYRWNGISVYALDGKRYPGPSRLFFWLKAHRKLNALAKDKDVIGVLSFWCNEAAFLGKWFAKRKSIQHKIWISGQDARKTNWFVNWIKPKPDDLVAMSHFLQDEFFKNHHITPSHVIPNAVAANFQTQPKNVDVIGAGSLIPLKNFQLFVEVIAEVKKTLPEVTARIFGNGPEEGEVRLLIQKLDLKDTITLCREVDHATLMNWMSRSKILLHPSSYEGYSTVCLEALANGCHVVSFTQAEKKPVPHWTIVQDKNEMTKAVLWILNNERSFTPIILHDMKTTVKSMMALYGVAN